MEDVGGDAGREGEVAASTRESLGAAGKAQCSNSPRTESLQGRCGYAASAFCDSLRNCAWALPAACGGCRGRRGYVRKRPVSELCPPCKVRTVGTFVWEGAAMRIGLLRFTAELRLGLTRRLRGRLGWRGYVRKRLVSCLCPPCKVRTVGTFVYGGCRGWRGEGWVEIFNVLAPRWNWKRDISQPVARGVVSVVRKAASLCVKDANLRRMS